MLKQRFLRTTTLLLNIAIVYYLAAIAALVITGGYQIEVLGSTLSSNRVDPLAIGIALTGGLRLALSLGLAHSALVLTSGLLALGASEILLRALPLSMTQPALVQIHQPSERYGFELVPNTDGVGVLGEHISINPQGARDAPFEKKTEGHRIVAVGDSFTFGFGVELKDSYVKQLEAVLRETNQGVQVLNLGVSAYNFWQYLEVLENRVPDLDPDLVLLGLYLDDISAPKRPDRVSAVNPFVAPVADHFTASALWNLVRNLWTRFEARYRSRRGYKYLVGIEERKRFIDRSPPVHVAYKAQTGTLPRERYAEFTTAVDKLAAWSAKHQVPVLVVFIPDATQIGDPDRQSANRTVALEMARVGIDFIDTTATFEAQPDPKPLFLFPLDAHTSPRGNALIAEVLSKHRTIVEFLE